MLRAGRPTSDPHTPNPNQNREKLLNTLRIHVNVFVCVCATYVVLFLKMEAERELGRKGGRTGCIVLLDWTKYQTETKTEPWLLKWVDVNKKPQSNQLQVVAQGFTSGKAGVLLTVCFCEKEVEKEPTGAC